MLKRILAIVKFVVDAEEKEQCLFVTSLISTTIQDKGKRERSNGHIPLYHSRNQR